MLIKFLLFYTAATTISIIASPVPGKKEVEGKVFYDQRQEGQWNVRADLKNFVILVIPTPTSTGTVPAAGGASLLDFLTKSLPSRSHLKHGKHPNKIKDKDDGTVDEETMHFIESKTAPYHVDISRNRNQLSKLHPEAVKNEDVFVANSPSVQLVKHLETPILNPTGRSRISRAFLLTVPIVDDEFVVTRTEDHKNVVKKDVKKKTIKEVPKQSLKLLGAENEQCGPGLARDSYGNCRTYED